MPLTAYLQALTVPEGTVQELKKARSREAQKRYRERHREKVRARDREQYRKERERAKVDPIYQAKVEAEAILKAAYMKAYHQRYAAIHREKIRANNRRWKQELKLNPEKAKAYYRQNNKRRARWMSKHPDKNVEYQYRYSRSEKGRATINAGRIALRRKNPQAHLKHNLRCRINIALRKYRKADKTTALIGCSIDFLKGWLESKFTEGMTWQNQGEWEIDHIRPCSSFNLVDPEQQKACFHYTNMQPLWRAANRQKSDTWAA